MSRTFRFFLITGILIFVVGAVLISSQRSRSQNELAKYKAELRAKGEKLSAEELGYPRTPESSKSLDQLQAAMNQIGTLRYHPSTLELTHFVGAGRAQVCWALAQPPFNPRLGGMSGSNSPTWEEFSAQFESITNAMQEIREATETPPRYFYNDPTNFANQPKVPFVLLRNAAQSLMGDTVAALHVHQLDRACDDLHALTQLARFNREDSTLVSQMIRVAISGLGLAVTWEALQAQGWHEASLVALQKDWEVVDLGDAFEKGIVGERAFGEAAFSHMRAISPRERVNFFKFGGNNSTSRSAEDYFTQFVVMPLWRANSETDEMFYLHHLQASLDAYRQLQHGTSWSVVSWQLKTNVDGLEVALSRGPLSLTKYRYLFSAIALPNYSRAAGTCVRNETQRRLTVTAIAIARYRRRNGHSPPDLNALVPQFLSAVPIDLMSAKPLRYILNTDGSFVLYSVGEDGRDNAGDPNPSSVTNQFDLWTGKDAVWPTAVFERHKAE